VVLLFLDLIRTPGTKTPSEGERVLDGGLRGGNSSAGGLKDRKITESLFIASLHFNDADLLRRRWIPALLELLEQCEKGKVYISILESGSWDDTKEALRELDEELGRLGVDRRIFLEDKTREDELEGRPKGGRDGKGEEGWIWVNKRKAWERRRIPFLAGMRNKVMEPLAEAAKQSRRFDKVIWLNDVIWTVS